MGAVRKRAQRAASSSGWRGARCWCEIRGLRRQIRANPALLPTSHQDQRKRVHRGGGHRSGDALARWFGAETSRVYRAMHENSEERQRRELLEWIASRGGRVTVRDL